MFYKILFMAYVGIFNLHCSIHLELHDNCIPYPYIDTLRHRTSRDSLFFRMIF